MAYPPHKLDKKYAYECEHSTHILSNLHGSEQLQILKGLLFNWILLSSDAVSKNTAP
jgi:hypothetical protein